MKNLAAILVLGLAMLPGLSAQNINIALDKKCDLTAVLADEIESDELLTFDDLGLEFGYLLYSTEVVSELGEDVVLAIDQVRDFGAVYINNTFIGSVDSQTKSIKLNIPKGKSTLRIYAENIGRITYGPEILDNSKGLLGNATLDGNIITSWKITPLKVKECDVESLSFQPKDQAISPAFFTGVFEMTETKACYLDTTGWGMGEAWINGEYLGAYWEKESQRSIPVPKSVLRSGENRLVIFDLIDKQANSAQLTNEPVFN